MNQKTMVIGRSGRGKTTLMQRLIKESSQGFVVIFDSQNEYGSFLETKIAAVSVEEIPNALDSSARMIRVLPTYDSDLSTQFCELFEMLCKIGQRVNHIRRERILLVCDEFRLIAGQGCDTHRLTRQIEICRRCGVDLLVAAHRVNHVSPSIREQMTELHHFQTSDPISLKWLAEVSDDPEIEEKIKNLPQFEYVTISDL